MTEESTASSINAGVSGPLRIGDTRPAPKSGGFAAGNQRVTNVTTISARTDLLTADGETYAYRRIGNGSASPLLCLQHFTGTLDSWYPAVIDALAAEREVESSCQLSNR